MTDKMEGSQKSVFRGTGLSTAVRKNKVGFDQAIRIKIVLVTKFN
jgi:hypothetical protein